jgi:hypothetical protein
MRKLITAAVDWVTTTAEFARIASANRIRGQIPLQSPHLTLPAVSQIQVITLQIAQVWSQQYLFASMPHSLHLWHSFQECLQQSSPITWLIYYLSILTFRSLTREWSCKKWLFLVCSTPVLFCIMYCYYCVPPPQERFHEDVNGEPLPRWIRQRLENLSP